MSDRYKVVWGDEARMQQLPGFEDERRSWQDDCHAVLYRCDDAGVPVEMVAEDRMEPEDASFCRDLKWVPVLLNQQAAEIDRLKAQLKEAQ